MIEFKPKELILIKLVCQDKTNREIAEKMEIGLRTAEKLKKRVCDKTKTRSSLSLFKWALKNGYYKMKI